MPRRLALHPSRIASLALFALLAALLFAPGRARAQESDPEAHRMLRLLCLKHDIPPEDACDALSAFVTTPPLAVVGGGDGSGMLDALFDPDYESGRLRALADRLRLPARDLAGAVYDYRVWELARQAAGRAPLSTGAGAAGEP